MDWQKMLHLNPVGNDYYVIIGCGRLGASLADRLAESGKEVLVIDWRQAAFDKLPPSYGGMTLTGDGSDMTVLARAFLHKAVAVIVVTGSDNMNAMIAQIVREVYEGPKVIARLYESECSIVYQGRGIETICPSDLSAQEVNRLLGN